ncbi:hypothetical protein BDN71DRAFT_522373 [Pleurotus eryngii]|uniref:F-box domain-containing protein n=1 Tax=Pleurotus eryngii TaxID=5323 RepID=A0A9P5ZKW4_PLEER|nr:hypothetical protein BDN71DRAFT_522373 [Pleurotus eryngii]
MQTNRLLHGLGSSEGTTSIYDLPPELLLIIFDRLYRDSRSGDNQNCFSVETNSQPPNFWFPYALAGVCDEWRALLALNSRYWTRICVCVDEPSWDVSTLAEEIQWSKELPIDLSVVASPNVNAVISPDVESARVVSIMRILPSFAHRCTALRFDLRALPVLPLLSGTVAPSVKTLELGCQASRMANLDPSIMIPFSCPKLETLILGGPNVIIACRSRWLASLMATNWTLYNYSPPNNEREAIEEAEAILYALSTIREDSSLTIREMNFDCSASINIPYSIHVETLILEDLSAQTVACLLRNIDFSGGGIESIRLSRCGLPELVSLSSCSLTLQEVPEDQDISEFLRCWNGSNVAVVGCPGFTDTSIKMLSRPFFYWLVSIFEIIECFNVSVDAVKCFVKAWSDAQHQGPALDYEEEETKTLVLSRSGTDTKAGIDVVWFDGIPLIYHIQ